VTTLLSIAGRIDTTCRLLDASCWDCHYKDIKDIRPRIIVQRKNGPGIYYVFITSANNFLERKELYVW
jgi:hypothetical protein